jgi:prolyl-tRNA synthetase
MKASSYNITTLKEIPADAEIASHQLLIRAGFIRKVASGIYNWLPIGLRVLQKIEGIIRSEMNAAGALEVLMPVVQPSELWVESGRWQQYDEGMLLKFSDRHQREFCLGPTHEEVMTDLAKGELKSHKQLPINYYQIQTKFRDETRPRFGVLRAREFIMKDAYSFHIDEESLAETYEKMHQTYSQILTRMHLNFRAVLADTGSIGGSASMEFHVLADSGEDKIAFSSESDYAANVEMAEALAPQPDTAALQSLEEVETPNVHTIEDVSAFFDLSANHTIKTLIVKGTETPLVALAIRGDHQLNPLKAEKMLEVLTPLAMATDDEIKAACGCLPGSLGVVGLAMPILVDRSAAAMKNFICGANKDGFHLKNANWDRDASYSAEYDLRDVIEGDPSPDGAGQIQFKRGIEVGHIFQLGQKYSKAMNASVLDDNGKAIIMSMGCYGMGVTRLVAAIVEQNHDDQGIKWPTVIAPFHVIVIPINAHKSEQVSAASEDIYLKLQANNIEVLLDDRDGHRPGVKFADSELLGIPYRIVVGDRGLEKGVVEFTQRNTGDTADIATTDIVDLVTNKVRSEI